MKTYLGTLIVVLLIVSCAPVRYEGRPAGKTMVASWYGEKFHGRPTASGEIFNMYDFTAAHKSLPFGTRLRIINPVNSRSVVVKINDRGPFVRGRDIDLSYAAARKIGIIRRGTSRVYVDYLGRDNSFVRPVKYLSDRGPFTVQVASFRDISNAFRLKSILEHSYSGVYIMRKWIRGERFYRIRVGRSLGRPEVERLAGKLSDEGYGVMIMGY